MKKENCVFKCIEDMIINLFNINSGILFRSYMEKNGNWEMAQQLGTLAILAGGLGLIPRTHSSSSRDPEFLLTTEGSKHANAAQTYTQAKCAST